MKIVQMMKKSDNPLLSNVAGFLIKTYEIFSNAQFVDICEWANDQSIVIKKPDDFARSILPMVCQLTSI